MTKLEHLEREVRELSSWELTTFREWFAALDATEWDAQIERDALTVNIQTLADKQFDLLKSNPQHPSLHFKRVLRCYSVRIGPTYRALVGSRLTRSMFAA